MGYSNKKYAYTNKIYYVQNCTLKKKKQSKKRIFNEKQNSNFSLNNK